MTMPPSMHALGITLLGARSPAFLDPFLRSGWTVGFGLGLRLICVAAIFCIYAWSNTSRSLQWAAKIHGVPKSSYLLRVVVPAIRPALFLSFLVVSLLAMADVSSTMLLQPPGQTTFGARIYSVMDNASARLVACLCLLYLSGGFLLVAACFAPGSIRGWRNMTRA